MTKSLKSLLSALRDHETTGRLDKKITGIASDSRKVKKGNLFVAVKGKKADGHDYINEAIKKGVEAVVVEDKPEDFKKDVTVIRVEDSRKALGKLAAIWFGNPSKKLKVVGVTGTDGKTTTAYLLYEILKKAGKKTAVITTVSAKIGDKDYETGLHVTNPESLKLQELLKKAADEDCDYAVLEVTSHGIEQKRIEAVDFDIGVLTNITHEHIDYHGTYEEYRDVKLSFLKKAKKVVLNKDDESFEYAKEKLDEKKVITYSLDKGADLFVEDVSWTKGVVDFDLVTQEGKKKVKGSLVAEYNLSNALAAIAAGVELGVLLDDVKDALADFRLPVGRLEPIDEGQDFEVYVDFAHTPNSLEKTLEYFSRKKSGKLISVFGSAGERDKEKRYLMGKVSGGLADLSVFTAEDPRTEDVNAILTEMAKGALDAGATEDIGERVFTKVPYRMEAVCFAVKNAKSSDTVVVAGKGHEKSMAYDGFEHPWSDQKAAKAALSLREDLWAVVFAAGKGTRMDSEHPKVLHQIAGRDMISYTLESLRYGSFSNIVVVVGHEKEKVKGKIGKGVIFANQDEPLGTGHACGVAVEKMPDDVQDFLVINGDDSAFYRPETLLKIVETNREEGSVLTVGYVYKKDPGKLGVIKRGENGEILDIEHWDGEGEPPKEGDINCGIYVFNKDWFEKNIDKVKKNESGEYYITDLAKIAVEEGAKTKTFEIPADEWVGVNTKEELDMANKKMEERLEKSE